MDIVTLSGPANLAATPPEYRTKPAYDANNPLSWENVFDVANGKEPADVATIVGDYIERLNSVAVTKQQQKLATDLKDDWDFYRKEVEASKIPYEYEYLNRFGFRINAAIDEGWRNVPTIAPFLSPKAGFFISGLFLGAVVTAGIFYFRRR